MPILAEMRSVFAPLYEMERQYAVRMRQFPDDHTLLEEYKHLHPNSRPGTDTSSM